MNSRRRYLFFSHTHTHHNTLTQHTPAHIQESDLSWSDDLVSPREKSDDASAKNPSNNNEAMAWKQKFKEKFEELKKQNSSLRTDVKKQNSQLEDARKQLERKDQEVLDAKVALLVANEKVRSAELASKFNTFLS